MLRTLAENYAQELAGKDRRSSDNSDSSGLAPDRDTLTQPFDSLRSAIGNEEEAALFACGGSVSILTSEGARAVREEMQDSIQNIPTSPEEYESLIPGGTILRTSPPVSVYWSPQNDGNSCRISLPYDQGASTNNLVDQLVGDCEPATFGRGDEDILDTQYRKAGKFDTDRFCTTFHPADFGILDTIEQLLLPSVNSPLENEVQFRRVRAELYKLNVYSGPSGLFQKHVDTPRSPNQFGSLVVCLPSIHKGGTLVVRHGSQTVEFNWDALSSSQLQWAAFYSDCEHEITCVTEGHRITLTYNLYVTDTIRGSLVPNSIVEPTSLPSYPQLKDLLEQPDFFPDGISPLPSINDSPFCSHTYAHASKTANVSLPRRLKGSDMALFAVLQYLGLPVKVLPILKEYGVYFPPNEESKVQGRFREKGYITQSVWGPRRWQYRKVKTLKLKYHQLFKDDFYEYKDIESRWKRLLLSRHPQGQEKYMIGARVGTELHPQQLAGAGGQDCGPDEVAEEFWPSYLLPGITMITSPKYQVSALAHLFYGNQASLDVRYSTAAILAVIPPWQERKKPST
ncbi:hypothetical protein AJ80_08680 [Polytolypa hystricis UAMH7299]|uniref:Fe2OG dioxygenase domain-containing protein n=1 Tax=Polytolypa hystricis (strain UAMH7299) TaxID=1447883 RepID=A0A2B7X3W5_POLH7|nr:hypothetical protein AJ80_08680 [Polytolypa hystricis UAMH7299]